MLGLADPIKEGRLFYGQTRRRTDVPLDTTLRDLTRRTITDLHELFASGRTPAARYESKKCDRCSLINLCMPQQLQPRRTAGKVFADALAASLEAR